MDLFIALVIIYLTTNIDARNYINKVFSSPKSGVICPRIDKNWKQKVDKYFEYITTKRDKYNKK